MGKKNDAAYLYAQAAAATEAAKRGDTLVVDRGSAFQLYFAVARFRARGTMRLQYYTGMGSRPAQWWEAIPDNAEKAYDMAEAEVLLEEAMKRAAKSDTLMIVSIQAKVLRTAYPGRVTARGEGES